MKAGGLWVDGKIPSEFSGHSGKIGWVSQDGEVRPELFLVYDIQVQIAGLLGTGAPSGALAAPLLILGGKCASGKGLRRHGVTG